MNSKRSGSGNRRSKQAQFQQDETQSTHKYAVILAAAFAAILVVITLNQLDLSGFGSSGGVTIQAAMAAGTNIVIPVSDLAGGNAQFYRHTLADGRMVEFFSLRSSDGVYRAALNACDVCFHAKKGYRQEGDDMVCNNCDQRFPSQYINVMRGGCNPVPLERSVQGDQLHIRIAEVETGAAYF